MNQFQHQHTAHCETGVMSSMLQHRGLELTESMVLGLSSGIAFAYLPFIKLNGLPLIAYRKPPRAMIKCLKKRLALDLTFQRFSNEKNGMDALNKELDKGNIVGMQTSVFWLPYFPEDMRFHFNAHNLIVYGRQGNDYLISDPVFEQPVICSAEDLQKARFVRGALAPKGMMYYLNSAPQSTDMESVIPKAIKSSIRAVTPPVPIIGINGIHHMANKIAKLSTDDRDRKNTELYLGHIVRMQEEIGTGGAGFRYMYASFLQEAATIMKSNLLKEASEMMTDAGDEWRLFALHAVKMCKKRSELDVAELSTLLHHCANEEYKVWTLLKEFSVK